MPSPSFCNSVGFECDPFGMLLEHEKNYHSYLSQANRARELWELIESFLFSYFRLIF